MTPEQKERLIELAKQMRPIAQRVGPLHGWWDTIFDIESFVEGKETLIKQTAEKWIAEAEEMLRKRK